MMKYRVGDHIIGKVYDLTQDNMNAMIKHIEELAEERSGLYAELIGQEHRLGSTVDRLNVALTTTSAANHGYSIKNVGLQARIEKFRAVLSLEHDAFYSGKCDLCKVLREDYEADKDV